jgi:DNA-binding response OmpR family regulator
VTKILAFEADQALAAEVTRQFGRYGCAVDVVEDGNVGLHKARMDQPDIILLTIELPQMNGFSICNKLKKNPELKDIPVIILSRDSTTDTLERHRKLRTHAEDYLRKPYKFPELIAKVNALVPLGQPQEDGEELVSVEEVDAEEVLEEVIDIGDESIELVVEDQDVEEQPVEEVVDSVAPSQEGLLDSADVDLFAESAFAAMQDVGDSPKAEGGAPESFGDDACTQAMEQPVSFDTGEHDHRNGASVEAEPPTAESAEPLSVEVESVQGESIEIETPSPDDLSAPGPDLPVLTPSSPPIPPPGSEDQRVATPSSPPVPVPVPSPAFPPLAGSPPGLAAPAVVAPSPPEPAPPPEPAFSPEPAPSSEPAPSPDSTSSSGPSQEELAALEQELAEQKRLNETMASEKKRLANRVEQLDEKVAFLQSRDQGAGAGGGSSRELLDLRESLNKKDRELLDLKDQINTKEKDILGLRERATALERELADGADKLLQTERQREELRDQLRALGADKELADRKVDSLQRQVEAGGAEQERLKHELGKERQERRAEAKARDEAHQSEIQSQAERMTAEAAAAQATALSEQEAELTQRYQEEQRQRQSEHQKALNDAEAQREKALTGQRLRHEEVLRQTEERLAAEAEELRQQQDVQHQVALDEAARRYGELNAAHQALEERLAEVEKNLQQRDEMVSNLRRQQTVLQQAADHDEKRMAAALAKLQGDHQSIAQAKQALAIALTLLADLPAFQDRGPHPSRDGQG